jgi:hypothetical protein
MSTDCSENSEIKQSNFECKYCDYKCSKKQHINQHYMSNKHKTNAGNAVANSGNETKTNICICGKKYKDRTGLWKHNKKCNSVTNVTNAKEQSEPENNILITYLMNENKELKNMIMDVCKNTNTTNNTTNNMNSNNKTFNLQVFLNEDCKDAMNIGEFVDSIKFQLSDLEQMGKIGYVDGISNIIIKNLKALDIHKRPVHCTDQKRETIYIKDEGFWTKEDDDNKKVRILIKKVAFRNSKCIRLFKEKHPDCIKSESRYSDTYSKIIIEAMGGGSKCNDFDSENKIIRKIAKEMTIDKSKLS